MNVSALNGAAYWNSFMDGSRGGWAEVCVETYLSLEQSPGNASEKVSFVTNLLNIEIIIQAKLSFSIGLQHYRSVEW